MVRLLGGVDSWAEGFGGLWAGCSAAGVPLVAAGGEALPDPDLVAASTVPTGVAGEAHRYLAAGGPANVSNLVRFLADTLLLTGVGFDPPVPVADVAVWPGAGLGRRGAVRRPDRPLVGVVFYRAHLVAGNTTYVADLCGALDAAGADALAVWTYSLRRDADGPSRRSTCAGSTGWRSSSRRRSPPARAARAVTGGRSRAWTSWASP